MADGRIIIDTKIDTTGAESGIASLTGKTRSLASTISKIAGGVTFAALTKKVVEVGSSFEATMSKVQAISGASNADMQKLTDAAEKMGATTKFSATESAQALTYMGMAGWKTQDMLNGLPGIMNLAAASGEDLGTTSDIVTDALTAFGMKASDSGKFADTLAAASSNANTNVSMLGESFKYCAPVCGSMGYNAKDTSIALGLMANSGVKASQAGTTLKDALVNMAKPTDAMAAVMDRYGLSLTNTDGSMKSLKEVMDMLREKMGGLDKATQSAMAAQLFGKEAMAGMLSIINASDTDYKKLTDSIYNCDGASQKMADTMNNNVQGSFTLLKSAAEGLAISVYDRFKGPLKEAIDGLAKGISNLTTAFQQGKLDGILNNIAAAIVGIGTAWATLKIVSGVSAIIGVVTKMYAAFKLAQASTEGLTAAQWLLNVAMDANPIGLIIAAIAGLVAAFIYLWNTSEGFRNFWIGLWNSISSFFTSAWNTISGFFTQTIPEAFNSLVNSAVSFGTSVKNTIVSAFTAIGNFFTQTIPQWIVNIANWFNQLPGKIGYALGFVLGKIVKWGVDSWNYLVTNVPKWISSIGTWFSELPGKVWTWLTNTITRVVMWGANMVAKAKYYAQNFINSTISYIKQLPGRVWTWLTNTVSKVFSWGYNLGSAGARAARQLSNAVVNGVKSIPGRMVSIGRNIVHGIWNGITGAAGWLKNKITGFSNSIVGGFKSALGIHSPSRVMRDMVGRFIPKGISVGIDAEMPKTIKGLKGNINGLYNELRGTVDTETAKTTASVAATNIVNNYSTTNNSAENAGIPNGSTFILQNSMDSATIGETVYKIVDGKLALQRRRVR